MKNILRLYKIMFLHWKYLLFGLFFMFGFSLFSAGTLTFLKPILDYIFMPHTSVILYSTPSQFFAATAQAFDRLFSFSIGEILTLKGDIFSPFLKEIENILKSSDPHMLLYMVSAGALLMIVLKNGFFYGDKMCFFTLRIHTIKDVRNIIFNNYMKQSLAFFNKNRVGDSLVRMVSDVDIVSNVYIISVIQIVRDSVTVLILALLAIFINPKLFLMGIIVLPLFPLIVQMIGKRLKMYAQKIQEEFSVLFSHVEEVLSSMQIVKAFSKEDYENEKFKKINESYLRYSKKSFKYDALNTPLSEINSIFTIIIILILGGQNVLTPGSTFSFGDFMVFLAAVASMLHPIKTITRSYTDLKKAGVSLERIYHLMDLVPEVAEAKNPIVKNSFDKEIKIKDVSFAYDEEPILKEINFSIKKGETLAIVGESGSGKTTLVNLIQRMFDTTKGEISIDSVPIKDIKIKSLKNLFGTVTQNSILFSDTIENNIAYGSPKKKVSKKDIIAAAKIAYADNFIVNFKDKYAEKLFSMGSNLSGGQKQRVCIARAIVGDPPVLIFDEATSALDTISEQNVQKAIARATANRTVIVIAHRLSTIMSSDRILVLDKGKVVGIDKHENLLKTSPVYSKLYNLQFNL